MRRYGITLRYAIITTFCAAAALMMGITDAYVGSAGVGGAGYGTLGVLGACSIYGWYLDCCNCYGYRYFDCWLNDVNRYFLCGRNKNWRDSFGHTRLHRAIYRQDIEELETSLASNLDLSIQTANTLSCENSTALVLANEHVDKNQGLYPRLDKTLAERVYALISDAVKRDIIAGWKAQTEETIAFLYVGSRAQLSRDVAIIISDYCFDDHIPKQIERLVNRNPQLQQVVQTRAIELIFSKINQRDQQEAQNKKDAPSISITVQNEEENKAHIEEPSMGYTRLAT